MYTNRFRRNSSCIILALLLTSLLQPLGVAAESAAITGERILFTLPIPLSRYPLSDDPDFTMDSDNRNFTLIIPVKSRKNDTIDGYGKFFVNGKWIGDYKQISIADFPDKGGKLIYATWDGKNEKTVGLPKFKNTKMSEESIEQWINKLKYPENRKKYIQDSVNYYTKTNPRLSAEEIVLLKKELESRYAKYVTKTETDLKEQLRQPAQEVTEIIPQRENSGRISGIKQSQDPNLFLIFHSPNFASIEGYLFKDGKLESQHDIPLLFHVASNPTQTKFAYRAKAENFKSESGSIVVVENGVEGKKFIWTSQPQYNVKDEIMYFAAMTLPKDKKDSAGYTCSAVIGKEERNVQCNDLLFFSLIFQSPYYRYPIVSEDGNITVYPELVKEGKYVNGEYQDGITSPFQSRLIINGQPGKTHYFLDKPYFTSKGLAVLSYTEKGEQFVEWNGKISPQYNSFNTKLIESLNFRGFSPLFAAIVSSARGDLGVEDIPADIIVSPDGNHIAYAGYKKGNGWTVERDMEKIRTHRYAHQLTFSPNGKDLAYVAIDGPFEPLVDQSFWLSERIGNPETGKVSQVMLNGKQIGAHEKILWLSYAPNGVLTYIGRDDSSYALYLDGKKFGATFDSILMAPRFKNDTVEIVGARGNDIVLFEQSLSDTTMQNNSEGNGKYVPSSTNSQQSIRFIKTFKRTLPSSFKLIPTSGQQSSMFYSDGKNVYAATLSKKAGRTKTYNLYLLEGETPSSFISLNPYYAVGRLVYSTSAEKVVTSDFKTGVVTYSGTGVVVISERAKDFMAVGKYATDGANAYYLGKRMLADVPSFQPLNTYFAKDKYSVFLNGTGFIEASVSSFNTINEQCGMDVKHTYCYDTNRGVIQMPRMDPDSFKYVQDGLAYDKNRFVCENNFVDINPAYMKIIPHNYERLILDDKHVYKFISCPPELLNDIDPNTLEQLPVKNGVSKVFLKDGRHVYYGNDYGIFHDADPATFRVLWDYEYSADAKHAYWRDRQIANADGKTFEALSGHYAKDAKRVFKLDYVIPGADPKTFKLLGKDTPYAIDAKHVYKFGEILPGVNPATFKIPVE